MEENEPRPQRSRRTVLFAALTALALLVALGTTAIARMGRPWGSHRGCHNGDQSPEAMRERAEFAADRALDRVDATDEQREQVKQIVGAAVLDLSGLRTQHQSNRSALLSQFAQETIDRAEIEKLRAAELELAEQASERALAALADAAEVLRPEQRIELVKVVEDFHR